jgi:hypothetical protein
VHFNLRSFAGSQSGIDIAQQNIPAALSVLEKAIVSANALENPAVQLFEENAGKFFKIMGPKAAEFAEQKAVHDAEIFRVEKLKTELIGDFAKCKGELEKYDSLVHVCEARINGTQSALIETRLRNERMQQLNAEVDSAIKAIPDTVSRTETTHHNRGWWFWGSSHTTTSTVCTALSLFSVQLRAS